MRVKQDNYLMTARAVQIGLGLILAFWLLVIAANGQTSAESATPQTAATIVPTPVWQNYQGVKIGTTADEVRDKLGKPKISDKDGYYYEINDDESAQIRLDADKKVRVISITYSSKNANAPEFAAVFDKDVIVEPAADGRIYKLVRYPTAGFWVAYNRTAGDKPIITVTVQKMRRTAGN